MKKWIGLAIMLLLVFGSVAGVSAAETKVIKMTAEKYHFTPEMITVNLGDKVLLEITATDTEHGFGLKAFNIDQNLPKGKTVRIEFVADKQGEFTFKCTSFCGWGHFGMTGKLVVS
ncbi:MAG: cupredoxin domain-containing protein [Deltaproteobacteria bacterium]|jgi:cytochrome c oxidase subunit 2|nr:cupredoxin domain-containing protein [Deltaproteobacteria bacterium]